jgi:hypothetical protein
MDPADTVPMPRPLRFDRVWWKRSLGATGVGIRWCHVRGQRYGSRSSPGQTAKRCHVQSCTERPNHRHGLVGGVRFSLGHRLAVESLGTRQGWPEEDLSLETVAQQLGLFDLAGVKLVGTSINRYARHS